MELLIKNVYDEMTMTEDVTELMTEHSRWHNFLPGIPRQVIVFTGVESNGILSEGRHIRFLSGWT